MIPPTERDLTLRQMCLKVHAVLVMMARALQAETFAKSIPKIVTKQHLVQLLALLPGSTPSRGEETEETKSFVTGAYSHGGGIAGMRQSTKQYPESTKVLTRYVCQIAPQLQFGTVLLLEGLTTQVHKDVWWAPLTEMKGGELWIQSADGAVPCPQEGVGTMGSTHRGVTLFDLKILHCTMPWIGNACNRIVLAAYLPRNLEKLPASDCLFLHELGFRLP